jgi:hypothetical protein
LSGSCDIQVEDKDKTGYGFYISVDEGSFRFFNDFSKDTGRGRRKDL